MTGIEKKLFWDRKILGWEKDKYLKKPLAGIDINASLKERMRIARLFLEKYAAGKSVLELGCGSGFLLRSISELPLYRYAGVDFSGVALAEAAKHAPATAFPVEWIHADVQSMGNLREGFDFVFSLGLLDWLDRDAAQRILFHPEQNLYFHSFTEKKFSLSRALHLVYVYAMYGHRTKLYVPQARTKEEYSAMADPSASLSFFRSPRLGIGCFLHNLPVEP